MYMRNVTHFYVIDADRSSRLELVSWAREQSFEVRPFLTGADFIEELPHLECGIVVIDVQNAGNDGFDVIESVARTRLACPIIAMTVAADTRVAVEALKRGAIDFLAKPIGASELHEAVAAARRLLAQRRDLSERLDRDASALARLTAREREVLAAMAEGKTSKMIASEHGISVRTVEAYRSGLLDKLGVPTAAAAIAVMVRYETALLAHGSRISAAQGR
jgi:FixJ family two-component response regulator